MDLFEIELKLKENLEIPRFLNYNKNIIYYYNIKELPNLVIENIEAITPLRYVDKNKKSVTVEILDNINSCNRDKRVGVIQKFTLKMIKVL
jgi:hypothetical protein